MPAAPVSVAAMTAAAPDATAHAERWPAARSPYRGDARVEARVDALLAVMSIEAKVGQLLQVDIGCIAPADIGDIRPGAILNGGNSAPGGNQRAPAAEWLALADAFWRASTAPRADGGPAVPLLWGTDAVHGHSNLVGATLFPHNIGLGAARSPALIRRVGAATAAEVAATGIDWSFAPMLALARDDRWGRTYESYSEDPALVASYAGAMVEGLQGAYGTPAFMDGAHVIATAKHFLGDGGTGGRDQGDTALPEETLIGVHAAGYPPAIDAGVLAIMASFSSWNGAKMHGNAGLLTDVLKGRMGFDGLLVGDWNAHAQLPGGAVDQGAAAINAGVDMLMVSGDWRALYRNTLADVRSGAIPLARLDDAVRRIVRVKALAGVLDRGAPSTRVPAGRFDLLGSAEHRALARQAVRESLVLLKNEGGVLPLDPRAHILVAGRGADDIARQSGGWTITWQGTDVGNQDFPRAQSIWGGIREAVEAAGGTATLSADGAFPRRPDAAIVVFGETPYAEFAGDRPTLEYSPADKSDLLLLRELQAAGVPVVAVFLSGRPLWVNAELNASDAFVAAFLPGGEGGGVADLLFRRADGGVAHDFRGKLSFSWPGRPDQYVLNRGDPDYDPLFAFGHGLSYAAGGHVGRLHETRPAGLVPATPDSLFGRGGVPQGWRLVLEDANGVAIVSGASGASPGGLVTMTPVDRRAQEDSRRCAWSGGGYASVAIVPDRPLDLAREAERDLSLVVELRVDAAMDGGVDLLMASGARAAAVPIGAALARAAVGQWTTVSVPLRRFVEAGLDSTYVSPVAALATADRVTLSLSDIRLASVAAPAVRGGMVVAVMA